jgi:hypothetical protein
MFGNNTSSPFVLPQGSLVAIFAGEATVTSVGANGTVEFIPGANVGGQLGIFLASSGFSQTDPTTWGAFNPDNTVNADNLVGQYTLKPQEAVFPGAPTAESLFFASDETNEISVNTGAPVQLQGRLLFRDVIDPLFVNMTADPNGTEFQDEGLIATIDEMATNNITINATALEQLNNIAEYLGQPADIGGFAFATGLNGAGATDFTSTALLTNGDLTTNLSFQLIPVQQTVAPEPASLAMWTLLIGLAGGFYWWKRNTRK